MTRESFPRSDSTAKPPDRDIATPTFSVVMPTFRRPEALREALNALIAQDYPADRFEVIVVDDDGGQAGADAVGQLDSGEVSVTIMSQDRRGAATARNAGARAAQGDFLLFVDDDIVVSPDHLARHAATLLENPGALINGAWQFTPAVLEQLERTPFGRYRIRLERHYQEDALGTELRDGIVEMPMLGSWDLAVARDVFWQIGGFDEAFPVAGAEDQDFSVRARREGCNLWLNTRVVCLHNDNRLDLRSYCDREQRSARTMPIIARKFPEAFGEVPYVTENRPIQRHDRPTLVVKKLVKACLAASPVLAILHRGIAVAEEARVPDAVLSRAYSLMLGLYLYRGFRMSWP